jgi:hypothetical protein
VEITVLKYLKLEFRGEWRFDHDDYAYKPADREGELIVVQEAPGVASKPTGSGCDIARMLG